MNDENKIFGEINEDVTAQVTVDEFAKALGLEILHATDKVMTLSTVNVNRLGMQLTGFFEHFAFDRIQLMGEMEYAYLNRLTASERMQRLDQFFAYDIPCLIITTGLEVFPEILACAKKHAKPLLRSSHRTTHTTNQIINYLEDLLAPTTTVHGVLMDLYGVGVLITGISGVGKSETALELVQRGHRLVADDAVIIRKISSRLVGTAPETIRYFMEVRGIGIIDVKSMYGVGAIKNTKVLDLVIQMESWDEEKVYDRLGMTEERTEILGCDLPLITLPIKPGRNLAVILEVAARNQRLKDMGYFAADELSQRIMGEGATAEDRPDKIINGDR